MSDGFNKHLPGCAHRNCVKLRLHDGTRSESWFDTWQRICGEQRQSLEDLRASGVVFYDEHVYPMLGQVNGFAEYVDRYGIDKIKPIVTTPENNGAGLEIHLTFPTYKLMDKFIKLHGGFGTQIKSLVA